MELTADYETKINPPGAYGLVTTIDNVLRIRGNEQGISLKSEGFPTKHVSKNPNTVITISSEGQIQITSPSGDLRAIEKTKSNLLKLIGGLGLN